MSIAYRVLYRGQIDRYKKMEKPIHKARRAIIMAAGIGKRLQPITFLTPKPLIKVKGVRMIDTVINALRKNGITEIYIVTGFLKEQFEELLDSYPDIKLIENPYYDSCNNISSLYVAREYLGDCIILDGDQIIYRPEILDPWFSRSGYCAAWCDQDTEEWLMEVKDGIVRSCSRSGGSHGWQLYSISFWTKEDGKRLRRQLEIEFEEKRNRQVYWDDVPMFCYFKDYELGIREIDKGALTEIDGLEELAEIDSSYKIYLERKEVNSNGQ